MQKTAATSRIHTLDQDMGVFKKGSIPAYSDGNESIM